MAVYIAKPFPSCERSRVQYPWKNFSASTPRISMKPNWGRAVSIIGGRWWKNASLVNRLIAAKRQVMASPRGAPTRDGCDTRGLQPFSVAAERGEFIQRNIESLVAGVNLPRVDPLWQTKRTIYAIVNGRKSRLIANAYSPASDRTQCCKQPRVSCND